MSSAIQMVKGCPLFYELYDDEINEIIGKCQVASFQKGDTIVKQGDSSTDIYVILDGKVDIIVNKHEQKIVVESLGKGDLFGEMVLINETKRSADIQCLRPTDVLIISYDNFYSYFHKKPKIFSLLVLNITRLLTKRLKEANLTIEGILESKEAA